MKAKIPIRHYLYCFFKGAMKNKQADRCAPSREGQGRFVSRAAMAHKTCRSPAVDRRSYRKSYRIPCWSVEPIDSIRRAVAFFRQAAPTSSKGDKKLYRLA